MDNYVCICDREFTTPDDLIDHISNDCTSPLSRKRQGSSSSVGTSKLSRTDSYEESSTAITGSQDDGDDQSMADADMSQCDSNKGLPSENGLYMNAVNLNHLRTTHNLKNDHKDPTAAAAVDTNKLDMQPPGVDQQESVEKAARDAFINKWYSVDGIKGNALGPTFRKKMEKANYRRETFIACRWDTTLHPSIDSMVDAFFIAKTSTKACCYNCGFGDNWVWTKDDIPSVIHKAESFHCSINNGVWDKRRLKLEKRKNRRKKTGPVKYSAFLQAKLDEYYGGSEGW